MSYILIAFLHIIGVGLHIMQKVIQLDKLYDDDTPRDVFRLFWKEDWSTVFVSALILMGSLTIHFIIQVYRQDIVEAPNYHLYTFGVALVLGYAGQRLVYKWLGKAEEIINTKLGKL